MVIFPGDKAGVIELPEPPDFNYEHLDAIEKQCDILYDLVDDEIQELKDNHRRNRMYIDAMLDKLYNTRADLIDVTNFIDYCNEHLKEVKDNEEEHI